MGSRNKAERKETLVMPDTLPLNELDWQHHNPPAGWWVWEGVDFLGCPRPVHVHFATARAAFQQ